eukprot:Lithocolla_globosa_v1_NODE_3533_length_1645_cov_48.722642.p3 type:complete len:100 gc:universal NODE_3533_length_1645_cov_48.722642:1061-762(-)
MQSKSFPKVPSKSVTKLSTSCPKEMCCETTRRTPSLWGCAILFRHRTNCTLCWTMLTAVSCSSICKEINGFPSIAHASMRQKLCVRSSTSITSTLSTVT